MRLEKQTNKLNVLPTFMVSAPGDEGLARALVQLPPRQDEARRMGLALVRVARVSEKLPNVGDSRERSPTRTVRERLRPLLLSKRPLSILYSLQHAEGEDRDIGDNSCSLQLALAAALHPPHSSRSSESTVQFVGYFE